VSLDWPPAFERTEPRERSPIRKFSATVSETTEALAAEMRRLDPTEWRVSTGSGGRHTKTNGLPNASANPDDPGVVLRWSDDGEQFAVGCDASPRLRDNLRTVYLWVRETRLRGDRPVVTGSTEFAAARLPAGDDAEPAGPPPHEVLGVDPDAPAAVVEAAARALITETHPDQGGSATELQRVKRARDRLLDEGGDGSS
jgi:hypothetical protein